MVQATIRGVVEAKQSCKQNKGFEHLLLSLLHRNDSFHCHLPHGNRPIYSRHFTTQRPSGGVVQQLHLDQTKLKRCRTRCCFSLDNSMDRHLRKLNNFCVLSVRLFDHVVNDGNTQRSLHTEFQKRRSYRKDSGRTDALLVPIRRQL